MHCLEYNELIKQSIILILCEKGESNMKTQEEYFNDLKKGTSLVELQNYINNVLEIRGFNNQSIRIKINVINGRSG